MPPLRATHDPVDNSLLGSADSRIRCCIYSTAQLLFHHFLDTGSSLGLCSSHPPHSFLFCSPDARFRYSSPFFSGTHFQPRTQITLAAKRTSMRPSTVGFGFVAAAQATYVWPWIYDDIENLLYLQSGYNRYGSLSDRMSIPFRCTLPMITH